MRDVNYSQNLIDDFRREIKHRLALNLTDTVCDIGYAIKKSCEKFNITPDELLFIIDNYGHRRPEIEYLISKITVGETYFYRDKTQIKYLSEQLLPSLIENRRNAGNLHLKIWSAGCSSGDELYTIAMILIDLIHDISNWKIVLLGTDINIIALHKAYKGVYSEWSMRSIPEVYKSKYFVKNGANYYLTDRVKQYAEFEYLNLADLNFPSILNNTINIDLILCRNVILYFSHDFSTLLMTHFEKCLNSDGKLLLGASDPILLDHTNFRLSHTLPSLLEKNEIYISINNTNEHLSYTSDSDTKLNDADSLSLAALENANKGFVNESINNCIESISLDPTNKLAYYVYALNLADQNIQGEAESAFKKALFLDRKFIPCLIQYGHFLLRNNRHKDGLRILKNALNIAIKSNPDDIVEFTGGISYKQFRETLTKEIDIYAGDDDE